MDTKKFIKETIDSLETHKEEYNKKKTDNRKIHNEIKIEINKKLTKHSKNREARKSVFSTIRNKLR